ncbi:MAG: hypothetical protein UU73_C0002G0193 [Candidatus Daviesbacteria bacterium GW2011_GWA1_41_61]|nr:MAG: hypothetical protein UU73_C0002G0193 [Candidatus Daviesbacteria bacterium GW2011_GWA1_41_61]
MEETLEAGLAKIFGTAEGKVKPSGETPAPSASTDGSKEGLLQQASQAYEAAIRAQREGDWGRYGEEIKRLGEILNKLSLRSSN